MAVNIKHGRALGALSMTPLIDVVFLLLIFFLVASRFAQEDRELDVILPSASSAVPLTVQPTELFVNVDHEGRFFVAGKFLDADEVRAVLEQAVANNPVNQSVIIRADERVPFRAVVTVMDLCNQTGIYDYSVTTAGEG
jgi:biopolymer transport protein ExbD